MTAGNDSSRTAYCRFGAEQLRRHLRSLRAEVRGVSAGTDTEAVHRMRVASRRLRAALPLFSECLPEEDYRRWREEIRAVTHALGEARDLDVQIGFLTDYSGPGSPGHPEAAGVTRLRRRLIRRRERVQSEVVQALAALRADRTLGKIRNSLRKYDPPGSAGDWMSSPVLYDRAFSAVLGKIFRVLAYQDAAVCPGCTQEHHELRIAVKRLRYTLEAFAAIFPGRLEDRIDALRNIQDLLGEMHDCDVWIAMLTGPRLRAEKLGGGSARGRDGIEALVEDRRQRRDSCYREFRAAWDREAGRDAWRGITGALSIGGAVGFPDPFPAGSCIGVAGDAGGDPRVITAILADARKEKIAVFVVAGNLSGRGRDPGGVARACSGEGIFVVPGRSDRKFTDSVYREKRKSGPAGRKRKCRTTGFTIEDREYLRGLPHRLCMSVGSQRIWIDPGLELRRNGSSRGVSPEVLSAALPAGIAVTGGPFSSGEYGGMLVASPGPAKMDSGPGAAYLVIHPDQLKAVRREVRVESRIIEPEAAVRKGGRNR